MISLERKTALYLIVIAVTVIIFGANDQITWRFVIRSEFPVIFNRYWFISVYVILAVLAPVLVRGLDRCSHKLVILVIVVIWLNNTFLFQANMTILQGIHIFIIGYYLRRFNPFNRISKWITLLLYGASVALYTGERLLFQRIGEEHSTLDEGLRYTLIIMMAVFLFSFFAKLSMKWVWPSKISGNVLAVYLITACPAIYHQLYDSWLHIENFCHEWWFMGYYLLVNVAMFAICVLIDKLVTKINRLEVDLWMKLFKKMKLVS